MRLHVVLVSGVLLAGLAGCVGNEAVPVQAVPVPPMELELLPGDRPVSAVVLWHEEAVSSPRPLVDSGLIIENSWEPRDVNLTYHGVQPVYDEWGRAVAAHVFRYEPMQLVVTDVEFLSDVSGVRITARYEPGSVEFAFAESDARYLGPLDLKTQGRYFADHRWPQPLAEGYAGRLMLALAYQALGGDLAQPIADPFGQLRFVRTDAKPLPGDCTAYEFVFEPAEWYRNWQGQGQGPTDVPEEEPRDLFCLQDEGAPLWAYMGNASDHVSLQRRGPAMQSLGLQGEPLQPRTYTNWPNEPLDMLFGLGKPVLVPPSASPGDWADQVRPVVSGVATSPDYVQWQLEREGLAVNYVSKAFPYFGLPLLPLVPVDPLNFEWTSWIWVADGQQMFWSFVDSYYGGPEDPDVHLSQRGFVFEDFPTQSPDLVASGDVQAAWEGLVPIEPAFLRFNGDNFWTAELPPEVLDYLRPMFVSWSGFEHCFEEAEGGRFADFSALNGQMWALTSQTSTPNGCSSGTAGAYSSVPGDGFLRLGTARHPVWLRPAAANGEPPVLVLPEFGTAHVLGAGVQALG